jgi:hypothetical protein
MMTLKPSRANLLTGLLLAALAFSVYLLTLSRTVTTEDPGELATALHTFGIVHPTGYPLFTLLGSLFARLPIGDSVILRLNLFGAVLTALATFFFYGTFSWLLSERAAKAFGSAPPASGPRARRLAAIAATLTYAFSAVYWREAVGLEVYALHLVFLALVTGTFLRAMAENRAGDGAEARRSWRLFAFVLGLSFTNHMMTVLLAPAFLFLYFHAFGFGRPAWKRILEAAPYFLLPLTLYLYLPLRSAQNPLMNWGEPHTLENFSRHLRAAQYGQMMFSSWEIAFRKLAQFAVDLPGEFGYAPLAAAAVGLWSLWRGARVLLAFTLLVFAGCLFYGVNYAFDDPNFYLNAHFMVALWAGFGLLAVLRAARAGWRLPAAVLCGGLFLFPLMSNYPQLDKSRDRAVEEYARNVLGGLDSGAVFFSNEYERLGAPAFYLQIVEGYRRDVVVLDIILLGNPWFYGHLEQRFPWLMEASRPQIEAYRVQVDRYVRGEPDTVRHNAALKAMFLDVIAKTKASGRPVYVSPRINTDVLEGYETVADGMAFRVLAPGEPFRVGVKDVTFSPLPASNPLSETIRQEYAEGYGNQGTYLLAAGDTARAIERMGKALRIAPEFYQVAQILAQLRAAKHQ